MSAEKITFHNVDRPTFEAVEERLLEELGGLRPDDAKGELHVLGVRGSLDHDEKDSSATVSLAFVPPVFSKGAVVGWLQDAFAGGLHWDKVTVTLANNASLDLSVGNVPNLTHGEWSTYPVSVPAGKEIETFSAESMPGAYVAPVGTVAYGLPDGTVLTVNFDMQFAVDQVSTMTASLSGARASSYNLAIDGKHKSYGGQGTRWTVTITLNEGAGSTSVETSYTR
ncbi:hypothetical protein [Umezawaea sp. NPDC059074]|uniref:hypothetical protein n=1 Tax=Umezawaea sp. NPDC059074 TaxID=3346716 RepID=UPI0036A110B7